ncbi:hypothetical protein FYC62_02620 [Pedobacter aquae]|uniref:Bacteriophage abortive infection AbiH n=1 Tax=Pedobacter aquae TaxID=2605747 RepID=A0A5C0VF05_9SPHI|nr:AbiH family protein [Pedobacter aquae]QEK50679.1 hypothetical protein FYC62_02620 [Pedobacter aquae]
MNRLVLIGNGFDLAHDLKTSYKDFIIWYLVKCFGNAGYLPERYQDKLLRIDFKDFNSFISAINAHKPGFYHSGYTKEDLIYFITNHFEQKTIKELLNIHALISYSDYTFETHYPNNKPFNVLVLSHLLRCLIVNCQDCNWVDIENEYFDQLKTCKAKDGSFDKEKIRQLNAEFDYLKQRLKEYLIEQEEQAKIKVIPELLSAIGSQFDISDFEPLMGYDEARESLGYDKTIVPQIEHNLYFLNFNYTNTVENYINELNKKLRFFSKVDINYIHGELKNADNPIIFGFGDEHDTVYKEFEEHRNNELFENIKSYQYLRTPNYRNLLTFLNSKNYQVFVMGHSCGLSDRTMLKTIFEHENCKSIRLFHYNSDFHDKAINVSKHFSNKGHMRKLIVDYKAVDAFPQSNKEA